jgi:NDP-sugar pyrophosphorylase family protein
MQAVILAAGRGKRMLHLTDNVPKPMLKINGKPLLEHKIEALPKEIDEIIFVIGYCGEYIMNHFGHEFKGKKIRYIFQKDLNGTGGAIHLARMFLEDKFMVVYGDDLYRKKDLQKLTKHGLAVLAREVDDTSRFGIIKTDRKGNLLEIVEKPKRSKEKLAVVGIFMLNKKFFDYDLVSVGNGEFGLPQTLATMAKDYPIKIVKATMWHPIGNPEDLKAAEQVIDKFVK